MSTGDGARLRPDLPRFALPCLSFVWEVVTAAAWRATDPGPGLIATDRRGSLGLAVRRARTADARVERHYAAVPARHDEDVLRLLDDRLADSVSAELTFAEWFSRWDCGPWPVVIDRIALSSAGLGPKSQCIPTIGNAERRNVALATLKRYGLALVPFSMVFCDHDRSRAAQARAA